MLCASSFCVTGSSVPGTTGSPAFCASRRAAVLSPKQVKQVRARADKSNSRRGAGSRQRGIFREKSVARMDGVDASLFRERHDPVDVEIGLDRSLALADEIGFVSLEAMQAEAIFVGIDGGGADLQFVGGAENADRNFAAIQGQKFFYRHQSEFPGISPHFRCTALAERVRLQRPPRPICPITPVQRSQRIRQFKLYFCWPTTW